VVTAVVALSVTTTVLALLLVACVRVGCGCGGHTDEDVAEGILASTLDRPISGGALDPRGAVEEFYLRGSPTPREEALAEFVLASMSDRSRQGRDSDAMMDLLLEILGGREDRGLG
jgi:hypothetical protein